MTKDETLRLALDTLKEVREETFRLMRNGERLYAEDKVWSTIIAIKEALETKDEPFEYWNAVGWFGYDTGLRLWFEADKNDDGAIPLYKNALEMANRALETKDATVQVSPLEFVTMVMEKEHLIGKPIFWSQWPNEEKK